MAPPPPRKKLALFPFAAHSARGLLRDQRTRRRLMLGTVVLAGTMILAGNTLFCGLLDHHAHPLWFMIYWLGCAWLTLTALLLAVLDLLMTRTRARAARWESAESVGPSPSPDDVPDS